MLTSNIYTLISIFVLIEAALIAASSFIPWLYRNSSLFISASGSISQYIGKIEQHRKMMSQIEMKKEKYEAQLKRAYFELNELNAEERLLNREFQGCVFELNLPAPGSRPYAFLISNNNTGSSPSKGTLPASQMSSEGLLCIYFSHSESAAFLAIKELFRKEDGYKFVQSKTVLELCGLYRDEKVRTAGHA